MKIRDVIRLIEKDGWFHVRTTGSHRQYHHQKKSGTVTVSGHPNVDIAPSGREMFNRHANGVRAHAVGVGVKQAGLKKLKG